MLSYRYLWRHEAARGLSEGQKPRPAAIVVAQEQALKPLVTVVPITHSEPGPSDIAIEIPVKLARHLGLDGAQHWIIVSEANQFTWPGFDIEPNRAGNDTYGFVPPALMLRVTQKLAELAEAGYLAAPISRDETPSTA